ncbi:MAG: hypothetical protein J0L78_15600 [Planctomycetes bacterium]|nr:hypothetical protein [Planctomycetota bacterium]
MRAARLIFAVSLFSLPALGAADPAPAPTPASKPSEEKPTKAPDIPDLDSLLGTKPDSPPPKPDAQDPSKKELDRQLSLKEQADEFARAVELMNETADRVEKENDAGLATQRLQEDILTRLDRLIKAAQQNQSKSKQQKEEESQKESQKNKNMRQQSQAQSKQAADQPGERADGPDRQEGALGNAPVAPPAAWGDLPAHVRDALMQGLSDKFSSMYQNMTESYYRKLAEEKKK